MTKDFLLKIIKFFFITTKKTYIYGFNGCILRTIKNNCAEEPIGYIEEKKQFNKLLQIKVIYFNKKQRS